MAFTLNRRLAQLVDGNGQLNTGKIPNDYITSDHVADNTITSAMLHTSFTVSTSNLTAIDTDDVSEGSTNLYFTNARADARIAAATTDDLTEGSTNLYFTNARVDTEIDSYLSGGTGVTYSSGAISIGQDVSTTATPTFGNITTTGYIAGPATFTIDPAAVGDNTGTVVIAGNLQVDGTTTTINSTTMTVDDLNITLASGAANAAAANGAGITVDGASATITYDGTNDEWDFNKDINVTGTVTADGLTVDGNATLQGASTPTLRITDSDTPTTAFITSTNSSTRFGSETNTDVFLMSNNTLRVQIDGPTGDISFYEDTGTTAKLFWDASEERLGIGTTSPGAPLHVNSDTEHQIKIQSTASAGASMQLYSGGSYAYTVYQHPNANFRLGAYGGSSFIIRDQGNSADRLSILNNGNVGIGTDNPAQSLHVDASGGAVIRVTRLGTNASAYGQLEHDGADTTLTSTGATKFYNNSGYSLTLDSSNNATFTGTISSGTISLQDSLTLRHSGVLGGTSTTDVNEIKWGSYGRLQHTSFTNTPLITFNAALTTSDFVGYSGGATGGGSANLNRFAPDYAAGGFVILQGDSGGNFAIATGPWNSNTSLDNIEPLNSSTYRRMYIQQDGDVIFGESGGKVGIGTDSPDSKLTVNVTSNSDGIELQSSETKIATLSRTAVGGQVVASLDGVASRPIHIGGIVNEDVILANAGGNVGIGTDNPSAKLDVDGSAKATTFSASNSITIDNSSGYAAMEMGGSGGAYIDLKNPSSDDYDLRLITFGSGGQILAAAGSPILLASDGNSNQLYLNSSGNVGIGTSNPQAKLHVTNSVLIEGGSTDSRTLGFTNANGSTGWSIGNGIIDSTHNFRIYDNTAGAARLTVDGSGNVGIGNAGPTSKLHIGSISTSGGLGIGIQNNSRYYTQNVDGGDLIIKDESAGAWRFRIQSNGTVKHANAGSIERIRNNFSQGLVSYSAGQVTQMTEDTSYTHAAYGMYELGTVTTRGFGNYVDFKTNLTSNNIMFMFYFTGYQYSRGTSAFYGGGYTYTGNSVISKDVGSGGIVVGPMSVYDIYRSSGGNLCVKLHCATTGYDEGRTNVFFMPHGSGFDTMRIIDAHVTNSTTNYY